MCLNAEQRRLVEENMGLVGKVISDKVRDVSQIGIYTYDDLFQIGCIGLCKAAESAKPSSTSFSTYAYVLIRNEIFTALEYATKRRNKEQVTDPVELTGANSFDETAFELQGAVGTAMESALARASGVTAKGIRALWLFSEGYTCREIGEQMGAPANHISAWISRARAFLKADPTIRDLAEGV